MAWERQRKEPFAAYNAFMYYLKLGTERQLEQVYERYPKMNWRYANRWRWPERAEAFDAHIAENALNDITRKQIDMNLRQAEVGREMLQLAQERLAEFKSFAGQIKALDAAKIAEIGAKLERTALGGTTREVKETKKTLEGFLLQINVGNPKEVTD